MAVIGYILLAILAAVVLLLCIPVAIVLRYKTGEPPLAYLKWLFLRFDLQQPEKPEKTKKKPAEPTAAPEPKPARRKPMEFTDLMAAVLDLISAAKGGVGFLIRRFRLYKIVLHMVVAQEDAAETAIAYGKINAAVYSGYAVAKGFLNMAQPDIEIRPDFTIETGTVDFELRGRLFPIHAIVAAIRIGFVFLVKTIKRKKIGAQEDAQNGSVK